MADQQSDPTHNIGADPLTRSPGAGRGGKEGDQIPEQIEAAESTNDTEHEIDVETQEERGAEAAKSAGHVSCPEEVSGDSREGHR